MPNHHLQGPTKANEAMLVYEELIDKYGSSALLLNGLAAAKMQLGLFEEAEAHLLEALTKVCDSHYYSCCEITSYLRL